MKDLTKLLLYVAGTIFLGALLAPPLYWSGRWAAASGYLPFLQEVPFQKFWNRAMLISAFLLLFPTIRWLEVRDLKALGFRPDPRRWQRLLAGFFAAFGVIVLLGVLLLYLGVYRLKDPSPPWTAFAKIFATAVTVSLLEECLFRGAILGLLRRTVSAPGALLASASLFAIVHFLKPDDRNPFEGPVTWWSGFQLVPLAFWQFAEPQLVLAGFTTLFCIGCILAYATLRTGSLWMAIGLHAGWILAKFGFSKLTKRVLRDTFPWFGADLSVGLGSVIAVLCTGCLVWWWLHYIDAATSEAGG